MKKLLLIAVSLILVSGFASALMIIGGFAPVQPLMGAGADGSEPVKYMIIGGIIANPIEEDSGM